MGMKKLTEKVGYRKCPNCESKIPWTWSQCVCGHKFVLVSKEELK